LEALEAPLPKSTRDSLFTELGFYDQDLYDLYSWKNGCDFGNLTNTIFTFSTTLLKLETVVEYKNRFPGNYLNFETLSVIFANEEDGFLFNSEEGEDYGKIHLYSVPMLSIDEPSPYFDSLESMLQTTIVMYKEKALYYDSKSIFLEENVKLEIEIYKRYNPKCRYYDANE
jgi:hypothetical protein